MLNILYSIKINQLWEKFLLGQKFRVTKWGCCSHQLVFARYHANIINSQYQQKCFLLPQQIPSFTYAPNDKRKQCHSFHDTHCMEWWENLQLCWPPQLIWCWWATLLHFFNPDLSKTFMVYIEGNDVITIHTIWSVGGITALIHDLIAILQEWWKKPNTTNKRMIKFSYSWDINHLWEKSLLG